MSTKKREVPVKLLSGLFVNYKKSHFRYLMSDSFPQNSGLVLHWLLRVLLVWCCAFVLSSNAAAAVESVGALPANPDWFVDLLEDADGTLTREDMEHPAVAGRFQRWAGTGSIINFGFTTSAYWLRLSLKYPVGGAGDWLLEIPSSQIQQIEFHAPGLPVIRTGDAWPLSSRPYFHRFFAFPLRLTTEPQVFYLRVASSYSLSVPLKLSSVNAFLIDVQSISFVQALYYGGLLALLLYNLLLYFSLRDARFLYYSLFVLTFGLGMLAGNGYGRMFLWPDWPAFEAVAQSFWLSVAAALGVLFTCVFLSTSTLVPRIHRVLRLVALLFADIAAYLLASLAWTLPKQPAFQMLMLVALPTCGLIIAAGVNALLRQRREALFFLLAWGMLWLGASLATLHAFGWIQSNGVTAYILQISSAAEMLLLALALADQVREARQAVVDVLRSSEIKLERMIEERTQQLTLALNQEKILLGQYMRFGALISHEFRNALGVINSQLSLLGKEDKKGIPQTAKRISIMAGACKRLTAMFDNWLRHNQIRQSLQQADLKPLALNPWLIQLLAGQNHVTEDHSVEFDGKVVAAQVLADASLLELAVINLLDNACKYSQPGKSVRIECREQPDWLGVAVIDQGIGIAPEHMMNIFKEYFRVAPEGSIRGMGLGLAMVQHVAFLHGGRLDVESVLGKGSTFCLWLRKAERGNDEQAR